MTAKEDLIAYLHSLETIAVVHGFHLDNTKNKAEAAILEEREACAQIADKALAGADAAAAIRHRTWLEKAKKMRGDTDPILPTD